MTTRHLDPLSRRVLRALYELSRLDLPVSHESLGRALSRPVHEMRYVLWVLAARGLACATRVRLTMVGLAVAARLPTVGVTAVPSPERSTQAALGERLALRRNSLSVAGRVAGGRNGR